MSLTIELPDDVAHSLTARALEKGISPSEVVREGLRLLEQREHDDQVKLEWLRAAAKEGFDAIDDGDYTAIESDEQLDTFLQNVHKQAVSELKAERERGR